MGALGPARYLLLMMGFFSFFAGIIYNDFTSIPLKLFGPTCYTGLHGGEVTLQPDCIYPVGVDPIWYMAKNELTYMNSLKMKLSVIFGVL
jgi:V-type H+-transporting ATPase subunit a